MFLACTRFAVECHLHDPLTHDPTPSALDHLDQLQRLRIYAATTSDGKLLGTIGCRIDRTVETVV